MSLIVPPPAPRKAPAAPQAAFPALPARRSLGELAEVLPTVVIDTREQTPLAFERLRSTPGTLQSGDYSAVGLEETIAIERKSIPDLVGCCGTDRDRFLRECHRLRGMRFKRLLVIGSRQEVQEHQYRSQVAPSAVLGTLAMLEARYDLPVVFASTPEEAAELVERWIYYTAREVALAANSLLRKLSYDVVT
jgi:DNA excision repair protein ERCC-4